MTLTREELKNAKNNVMVIMENRIMPMIGCDRTTANLIANEVLNLDRDAEFLLNNPEDNSCYSCKHYAIDRFSIMDKCYLEGDGCQTNMYECFEGK